MTVVPTIRKTRVDLRRRVRHELHTDPDGAAPDHWNNDRIDEDLNEAQSWVQMKLLRVGEAWSTKPFEHTMNGSDYGFLLPADFIRDVRFEKQTSGDGEDRWVKVTIVPPTHVRGAHGWPVHPDLPREEEWEYQGNQLRTRMSSPPTGIYRLTYIHRLPDLQSDQQPCEAPPEYHDLVVKRAAYMAARRAGERQLMSDLKVEIDESVSELYATAQNRSMSVEYRTRDAMGYSEW